MSCVVELVKLVGLLKTVSYLEEGHGGVTDICYLWLLIHC